MSGALYSRDILRLAVSIPHQQRLANPDGSAERRSKACGSRVIADVRMANDGRIKEIGLEISACALGQASAAILGGEAYGKPLQELTAARDNLAEFLAGKQPSAGEWKQMSLLEPAQSHKGRHAAILLPFDTLIAAMEAALAKQDAI